MTEQELIQRVATAINRNAKAQSEFRRASEEALAAATEIKSAWAELNNHLEAKVEASRNSIPTD
jgi:hypothetical protein